MISYHRGNYTRKALPEGIEGAVKHAKIQTDKDGRPRRVYMRDAEKDPSMWIERADRVGPVEGVVFLVVERNE